MKAFALSVVSIALAATASAQTRSSSEPAELTPEEWRAAAQQDIKGIHDVLRDNAPFMVVDRDSAEMRRWLEAGRTEALKDVPSVKDAWTYNYVLRRYVGGFRDGHIGLRQGDMPENPGFDWPGFRISWQGGRFRVSWVPPGAESEAPPIGAELVSCDGQPAEVIAANRIDRIWGNLNLEATRRSVAHYLLLDFAPYGIARPKACSFLTSAGPKEWSLHWSHLSPELAAAANQAMEPPKAKFGVNRWGENAWWIGAPAMQGEDDWRALNATVAANLDAIRSADAVVIDLRGNGGGSSEYGDKLARQLWGNDVADAHAVQWGDLVFKAGAASRRWAALNVGHAQADPNWLAEARSTLKQLEAARPGSKVTIKGDAGPRSSAEPPNPIKGNVVVLVDQACFSACLDALDLFTRMPGVKIAGVETGADTIFMDTTMDLLPSTKGVLVFGIKAWAQRERGSNVSYKPDPSLLYAGDLANETALKNWLGSRLGVKDK